jgi:hypothetical protein
MFTTVSRRAHYSGDGGRLPTAARTVVNGSTQYSIRGTARADQDARLASRGWLQARRWRIATSSRALSEWAREAIRLARCSESLVFDQMVDGFRFG